MLLKLVFLEHLRIKHDLKVFLGIADELEHENMVVLKPSEAQGS